MESSKQLTGLPATWFADADICGNNIRLAESWPLDHGYELRRGEVFWVVGTSRPVRMSVDHDAGDRYLLVRNPRAFAVPVPDFVCELLFEW